MTSAAVRQAMRRHPCATRNRNSILPALFSSAAARFFAPRPKLQDALRRFLKFLHTMGSIGLMGSMASLLVLLSLAPAPTSLESYALIRGAMGAVATWIFFPSLGITLVAGLLALGLNRAFHSAGWALAKLATGVLVFEAGFVGVLGPMQEEAEQSAKAMAGQVDPATLTGALSAERYTIWLLLAVATVNVVLGIWRPRFTRRPGERPPVVNSVPADAGRT